MRMGLPTHAFHSGAARLALLERVLPHVSAAASAFWTEHKATVEAGLMVCGGADRSYAVFRQEVASVEVRPLPPARAALASMRSHAHLPPLIRSHFLRQLKDLAAHPETLQKALYHAFSYPVVKNFLYGFPDPVVQMLTKDDFLGKALNRQVRHPHAHAQIHTRARVRTHPHIHLKGAHAHTTPIAPFARLLRGHCIPSRCNSLFLASHSPSRKSADRKPSAAHRARRGAR